MRLLNALDELQAERAVRRDRPHHVPSGTLRPSLPQPRDLRLLSSERQYI